MFFEYWKDGIKLMDVGKGRKGRGDGRNGLGMIYVCVGYICVYMLFP